MTPETEQKLIDVFDQQFGKIENWISPTAYKNLLKAFLDSIPQIQSILQSDSEKVCEWKEVEWEDYKIACNNNWITIVSEAKYTYCPFCGGKIKEVQPLPQSPKGV